jgi:RNA polymerase sigma-70 factor (ECF subfamily)
MSTQPDLHRTTQQLVLQSQNGDREAFSQLFDRYYPRIRLLVKLHMLDKLKAQVEADDIIQEIYLEVFRNFHKFEYRDPNSFYKWLVTVIGWKIRDFDKYFFKTSKRQPGETLSLHERLAPDGGESSMRDLADSIRGNTFTPSQIAVQREGYRMLEAAMEKLPPHYREVIRLRHLEQRSAKETAEILELKVNAVNVLFHRAQQKLHEVLREMAYFSE